MFRLAVSPLVRRPCQPCLTDATIGLDGGSRRGWRQRHRGTLRLALGGPMSRSMIRHADSRSPRGARSRGCPGRHLKGRSQRGSTSWSEIWTTAAVLHSPRSIERDAKNTPETGCNGFAIGEGQCAEPLRIPGIYRGDLRRAHGRWSREPGGAEIGYAYIIWPAPILGAGNHDQPQ